MNEAACLKFVREHTDIPVPRLACHFEDNESYYLYTKYIEGRKMTDLSEKDKETVSRELQAHNAKLRELKSTRLGGPSGIVIPPCRVLEQADRDEKWDLQPSTDEEYVFAITICHRIMLSSTRLNQKSEP